MVRLVRILAGLRVVPTCQRILLVAYWKPVGDYESPFLRLERESGASHDPGERQSYGSSLSRAANELDLRLSDGMGLGGDLLVPPCQAVGQLLGDLWGNLYFLYDLPGGGDSSGQTLGNFLVAWHYGN